MTTCASPIPFETLVDWWTGELADSDGIRVEEHIFACDSCAAASTRFAELAGGLHEQLPPVISHAHRDRLLAGGTRIRLTPVDAGVNASAIFSLDVDLLVHVLRADLSGAERVDVEVVMRGWSEPILCEAVPFDAKAGEVLICCQRHFQYMGPPDIIFRVHAVEAGQRRLVGDYPVLHEFG
jgi:hypothetical protein